MNKTNSYDQSIEDMGPRHYKALAKTCMDSAKLVMDALQGKSREEQLQELADALSGHYIAGWFHKWKGVNND